MFDHPEDDRRWLDRVETDLWQGEEDIKARYIAKTFASPEVHLARFSDRQVANALEMIIAPGGTDYLIDAYKSTVPLDLRLGLIRATEGLFTKLFAKRCSTFEIEAHSHLHGTCYMFWDLYSLEFETKDPARAPVAAEKLALVERILDMDNLMCQYSALHGLGHAQYDFPERVAAAIDRYLARHPEPEFALREYALKARSGCVQ
jgi:hypothetical protein